MESKYQKIATRLRMDILAGEYTEKLPSERDLAERFDTTQVTIRKAQELLISESLLVKKPPLGTFVQRQERPVVHVSLLLPMFPPAVLEAMLDELEKAVPSVDVRFHLRSAAGHEMEVADCDLIGIPGLSPLQYDKVAIPFGEEVMARLDSNEYFAAACHNHRRDGLDYGLPILFSPTVLMADKTFMRQHGFPLDPYALDASTMADLADMARQLGIALWDVDTVRRFLGGLVFSAAAPSQRLRDIQPVVLAERLEQFAPVLAPEVILQWEPGLETKGKSILQWTCRQALPFLEMKQPVIYTWPKELQGCSNLAGEFLLLNRNSRYQEAATQIALQFLSHPIQRLIGESLIGLPVHKGTAVDSIQTDRWRDDVFLTGVKTILANNGEEQGFYHRLHVWTEALTQGALAVAGLRQNIEHEIALAQQTDDLHDRFLANMTDMGASSLSSTPDSR